MTSTTTPERTEPSVPASDDGHRWVESLLERVTLAHIAWFALFILACLTRLWGLGERALHHDESLHTYYSWVYSEGLGYEHHPMMHGPFLFHINAFSYLLFGSSDFTSRLTAAIFGIALVMLPWFLRGRNLLGTWGAIAASTLILVSPSLLYYSRFIRHDIFAVVGAFLLFIAVVRYMEKPESRWIILAVSSVGFVWTTHEITFVNLGILGLFTGALIIYRVLGPGLLILGGAGLLFLLVRAILNATGVRSIPEIPWQEPSTGQVIDYLAGLVTHPVIATALSIGLLTLIVIAWLLERRRDPEQGWIDGTLGAAPEGSTAQRFGIALHDRRAWAIGAAIGGSIFVLLYTSLFSNMGGLGSGTFGAIGYWLAQHDVQRGEQPWYYYLILAPQYEYLAVLGATATTLFLAAYAWRHRNDGLEYDRRFYTLTLAAVWAAVMFLTLSWAGEKMPWLIVHFLLPMTILTGGGAGMAIEWVERQSPYWKSRFRGQAWQYGLPVGALLVLGFLLLNWASAGEFRELNNEIERTVRDDVPISWWIIYLPSILALVVAALGVIRIGARRILTICGGVLAVLLLMLQMNAGWGLNFRHGDVPRDMLIYVQTSPHLKQTVRDLERLSHELTGGMDLRLQFTSETQWPLNWYLREFNNRALMGEVPDEPDVPIIITSSNEIGSDEEESLEDYSYIEMPLRWWVPENETYRRFAISPDLHNEDRRNLQTDEPGPYGLTDVVASVGRTVRSLQDPEQQGQLFRLVVHRELIEPIGGFSMRLYIHDDYRHYVEGIRYRGSVDQPAS